MKAVVMAGGEGSRLRPLTSTRPKPLVPVVNRPILWHVLQLLKKNGFDNCFLTLHYLADQITSIFGDGSDYGISLQYSFEDRPLGTAGSVKILEDDLDERFLVISGDVMTDFQVSKLVDFHKKQGSAVTIGLARVENPLEYGVVMVNDGGRVVRFLEKPGWSDVFSDTVNSGIYVIEPEILKFVDKDRSMDFSKELFPKLMAKGESISAHVLEGYWADVGVPSQYITAHHDVLSGRTRIQIPGQQVSPGVWIEKGSEVSDETQIYPPVAIGSRCRIEKGSEIGPFTCVGSNTIVEMGSHVARSVVFDFVYVGRSTEIKGCVLGKNVLVRPRARVFEGAVVGDGCQLGSGSEVAQGIKIWPDKIIESGASVHQNLVWGLTLQRKIFGSKGIVGLSNIEITPEITAKLGAAFGTFLGPKAKMVAARDTLRTSRMLKRSFLAGILATGATIFNIRASPAPVARLAIQTSSLEGGVYFGCTQTDLEYSLIQFFDERGYNIRIEAQRKIEDIMFKEEIHRSSSDELSDIYALPRVYEDYREVVLSFLDGKRIAEAKPRVVVDCSSGPTSLTAPQILASMGCEVISLNTGVDSYSTTAITNLASSSLRDIVTAVGAVAGFRLSPSGESLRIVDETGSFLDGDEQLAVMIEALLTIEGGNVAIPISSSASLDELIEKHGWKAKRVKTDPRALMESVGSGTTLYGGNDAGEFIISKKLPFPDALAACIKIIEYLSNRGRRLSKIRREVYQPRVVKGVVVVPWNERGRIMRKLAMDFSENRVETLQGVKLLLDDGWVLVNPSPDEPVFEIFAESTDSNKAMALLDEFKSRVSDLASPEGDRTT
jgi:mannose-1-phosphate guanylyltransferase/phosphomannomutase